MEEKFEKFFEFISNNQNLTVADVDNQIKEIFENEYIEKKESINQAYYQMYTKTYYFKNGVYIREISGNGDKFGENVSHIGTDIIIYSSMAKEKEYRNGIAIFYESEFINKNRKLIENWKKFFDLDLSPEILENIEDSNIYTTLADNIKNNEYLMKIRYKKLEEVAICQHEDEVEYDLISPYGRIRCYYS